MNKILFIDDDRYLLDLILSVFRCKFDVEVADSGRKGLSLIRDKGPFAVVASDFEMSGMDGAAFLAHVAQLSPDSVRMMLTGNSELSTAIRAVNEGKIFRFLTKPCALNVLEQAFLDGLRQHQLIQTEREYLSLKRWNESLGGLVQALVRLTESKDPYTAGHQIRVSRMSEAIAKARNLPDENVEQIRMAAMIHDVGKIYVPAEFLNKPGVLSKIELAIIRMHAQIGHDILEPINFPFPIHKIILQHHERMDGSGYPLGLRGSEIMPESKIISVADVLEAISHHRPYRPALGKEEAMKEIQQRKGTKYDAEIVEAAQSVFAENLFRFD